MQNSEFFYSDSDFYSSGHFPAGRTPTNENHCIGNDIMSDYLTYSPLSSIQWELEDGSSALDPTTPVSDLGPSPSPEKKRKVTCWTKDEHKLFLIGLQIYGKGHWKSIATEVAVTKTAAQVASHAQKFYSRKLSSEQSRKRSSINDITTVDVETMSRFLAGRPAVAHFNPHSTI
ncbi:transcription factor SRM1-like [Momordica charantia]|uniref:Transcription factor SRM1-like n=1 Tax=Momordica charantia TaxID=3673 RepID=A0A6J1CV56_MOMCH|nr:transcription factor SRM1-like [Momordica charantia]